MSKSCAFAAVILAAGRGSRFGGETPKQYYPIGGQSLLSHTVRVFVSYGKIDPIVVVFPQGDREETYQALGDLTQYVLGVEGGATRQQSALLGLRALQESSPHYVHIHDGARPFVSHALLDVLAAHVTPQNGVVPALAVSDTLKKIDHNSDIAATIDREGVYQAQTPQIFPFSSILAAHEQAALIPDQAFTDDASVAEWYGLKMRLIEGEVDNIKITKRHDLERAHQILNMQNHFFPDIRTGHGYDVHLLEPGDHIILCGVAIPHHLTLSGHSDADVALHALTDALLATLGAGDIGTHFPPSDPQWRGAQSHIFVTHALSLIRAKNGRIANIDITLIAEAPKIAPHRPAMVARLAEILNLERERISIKATTNERLGFIGRNEGIAALASANVLYPGSVPAMNPPHDKR